MTDWEMIIEQKQRNRTFAINAGQWSLSLNCNRCDRRRIYRCVEEMCRCVGSVGYPSRWWRRWRCRARVHVQIVLWWPAVVIDSDRCLSIWCGQEKRSVPLLNVHISAFAFPLWFRLDECMMIEYPCLHSNLCPNENRLLMQLQIMNLWNQPHPLYNVHTVLLVVCVLLFQCIWSIVCGDCTNCKLVSTERVGHYRCNC